jgi:hypothetical protein
MLEDSIKSAGLKTQVKALTYMRLIMSPRASWLCTLPQLASATPTGTIQALVRKDCNVTLQ